MAAPVPNRLLLRVVFGYLVLVLLGTVGLSLFALVALLRGLTNETKGAPFIALVGLLIAPVWLYLLEGVRRRLHGEANAQLLPPGVLVRSMRLAIGVPALAIGAIEVANILRAPETSTGAAWGGAIALILVGGALVFRAVRS